MAALRTLLYVLAAAASLTLPGLAYAQTDGTTATFRNPLPRPTGHNYLGLNLGRSHYNVPCGTVSVSLLCDDTKRSVELHAGTALSNFWGVELGYLDMGRIARADARTQGLNLSLVGRAPVGRSFGVFGKVGTTRTDASSFTGSGLPAAADRGFGLSYGAGVSFDFTPRLSATLEWDSNDFRFPGSGRDAVRSTSLGLQYRY